jgi:dTDP-4-amino-4,6-dideoxygalactose transaminase
MFYLVCRNGNERDGLLSYLKQNGILAVFHYLSLHKSPFYAAKHDGREIPLSDLYSDCLVRLPLFYELSPENIKIIIEMIYRFYETL